MTDLQRFVSDFARGVERADAKRPQATNIRSKAPFQPGIGPHTEAQTLKLVGAELEALPDGPYAGHVAYSVPYPESPKQKCDLCLGNRGNWLWAIEAKMLRILGDNGKANDNILMHILSPYPEHRSALTDCSKLSVSALGARKAILIYGYEAEAWPIAQAIEAFEALARLRICLGPRCSAEFAGLVHPVHSCGGVFGWEVSTRGAGA